MVNINLTDAIRAVFKKVASESFFLRFESFFGPIGLKPAKNPVFLF